MRPLAPISFALGRSPANVRLEGPRSNRRSHESVLEMSDRGLVVDGPARGNDPILVRGPPMGGGGPRRRRRGARGRAHASASGPDAAAWVAADVARSARSP